MAKAVQQVMTKLQHKIAQEFAKPAKFIDDAPEHWVLKRQPHWRKTTVAERIQFPATRGMQYTVPQLVEELRSTTMMSDALQASYDGLRKQMRAMKKAARVTLMAEGNEHPNG